MTSTNSSNTESPLHELFLSELANMHSGEKQLARALPLMAKAADSEDLQALLETHQKETKGHAEAIEDIAESLGAKLPHKTCYAIRGLIEEGVLGMVKNIKSPVLDAALITAGRKIEQYEIASYGTLCRWAKEMGYEHELAVLVSILNQEKLADTLLAELFKGAGPLKEVVRQVSQKKIQAAVAA
jgi:ferritin-like metal-binding protein YciE